MSKGLVFKVSGSTAVVLEDGQFRRVPAQKGWKKGDEVDLAAKGGFAAKLFSNARYAATLAASVALMLSLAGYAFYHYLGRAVSYVSIDVNPSIELGLNSFDWVVTATGYNEEGSTALESLRLFWMSAENAVKAVISSPHMEEFLDDNTVVVAVSSGTRQQAVGGKVSSAMRDLDDAYEETSFLYSSADWSLSKEAHDNSVTPGKMALAQEIAKYDDSTPPAQLAAQLTTSELIDLLQELQESEG